MDTSLACFGPFTFDLERMILRRDGEVVPIGGRGAALLSALVNARGEVVTRAELLDAVWPNLVVEERNLTVQIANLRKAMGNLPESQDPIRTVLRVGYKLVPDTSEEDRREIATARPSVAVLPFANLSPDPDLAFFADGLTEDLITALSRFQTFAVVARSSTARCKEQPTEVPDVARELGVRYVVEGSVRRSGSRIRVHARLADAMSGIQLWGESFEGTLGDIFDVEDRITESVVGLVEPEITQAEIKRARRKRPESLDAYDHFLRGLALLTSLDADTHSEMVCHFDRAVELDPIFPQALALAAWTHEIRRTFGGVAPPGVDDFAVSLDLCERALAVAGSDALVLAIVALEQHALKDDAEGGIALVERALALNPNSYLVLDIAATIHQQRGRYDRAIALHERAMRLSPNSPLNYWSMAGIADAHLNAGRFEEAIAWGRRCLDHDTDWDLILVTLMSAYAMLDRMEEAQLLLERFLKHRPGATIRELLDRLPPAMRTSERYWTEGLRRVGLPSG